MQRTKIKCEKCGKEISKSNYSRHLNVCDGNIDTGYHISHEGLNCIYCGKLCKNKNSLAQHEIKCPKNPNRINVVRENFNSIGRVAWNKGLTAQDDIRVKAQADAQRGKEGTFKDKHHSKETRERMSKERIQFLKDHPEKVPYLLNHSSKLSYPEQYFIELFDKENIPLLHHKQISYYQLDFYNDDLMIDVEVDGEQHYLDSRIVESDKRRTQFLENLGWKVYRIRWSEYQRMTDADKHNIILDIKQLLNMRC